MRNRRTSSRASLLAAALLVGLVAAACVNPEPVSGNKVLLVGDSLMNQSRGAVTDALTADGWDVRIQAQGSTTITQWAERFPLLDYAEDPNIIVIELGTNDCSPEDCPNLQPYIDEIMKYTTSADAVVWLNVLEDNPLVDRRDWVNDQIEQAVSRHPKLFLADMNGEFEGRDEVHTPDGIHFNDEGQKEFAEFIREQLEPFKPVGPEQ